MTLLIIVFLTPMSAVWSACLLLESSPAKSAPRKMVVPGGIWSGRSCFSKSVTISVVMKPPLASMYSAA